MSKESLLFSKIVEETESGQLSWRIVPRGRYSEFIFQPKQVFRIFETNYTKDDDSYTVLLVEKKYDDPEWDFAVERYRPEMYFLFDDAIVLVIDEDSVDMNRLVRLVKSVEVSTDRAKRLLG